MKNSLPIALTLFLAFSIWSCKQPKSPDFKVEHSLETPLTLEDEYKLLGTSEALVDTLSSNYLDSLEFSPFRDTLKADFSIFPNNKGDHIIKEANIDFKYANEIPLDIDISLFFLEEKRNLLFKRPTNSEDRYIIKGNSENLEENNINISFLNQQLDNLNKTRYIVLKFDLKLNKDVELSDYAEKKIRFKLNLDSKIISTVN